MIVLKPMPRSSNVRGRRLRVRVAMTTCVEDDAGDGRRDVNEKPVRHGGGLQTSLVPSSYCDVIARAVLQVPCGKGPVGV
jgi:hypothetical protein